MSTNTFLITQNFIISFIFWAKPLKILNFIKILTITGSQKQNQELKNIFLIVIELLIKLNHLKKLILQNFEISNLKRFRT